MALRTATCEPVHAASRWPSTSCTLLWVAAILSIRSPGVPVSTIISTIEPFNFTLTSGAGQILSNVTFPRSPATAVGGLPARRSSSGLRPASCRSSHIAAASVHRASRSRAA